MSYQIDIYRGDSDAEHNFLRYSTYATLFPHMLLSILCPPAK